MHTHVKINSLTKLPSHFETANEDSTTIRSTESHVHPAISPVLHLPNQANTTSTTATMSGPTTTKEFISHTSRETESSHKATPQRNSSSTESREVAAAKKSFSVAKAPVTSAAAVKSTKATVGKRPKPPANLSGLELGSVHAKLSKIRQVQAAFDAKAAQDAAEKKAKADAEKLEAAQKRQERIAFLRGRGKNTSFDTTWVIKPQRNSAPKKPR